MLSPSHQPNPWNHKVVSHSQELLKQLKSPSHSNAQRDPKSLSQTRKASILPSLPREENREKHTSSKSIRKFKQSSEAKGTPALRQFVKDCPVNDAAAAQRSVHSWNRAQYSSQEYRGSKPSMEKNGRLEVAWYIDRSGLAHFLAYRVRIFLERLHLDNFSFLCTNR